MAFETRLGQGKIGALGGDLLQGGRGEAAVQAFEGQAQVGAVGGGQRGRAGGSGRAQVGGKIGQGEIGLVAHPADHGGLRGDDGAHHAFVVEGPQVFQRAAAAGDEDHIRRTGAVKRRQGADDGRRSFIALHRGRREQDLGQRVAPPQGVEHILQGRAGGRGDQADSAREGRDGALAFFIEEPFTFKSRLEPQEFLVEKALSGGAHGVDVELVGAVALVDPHRAVGFDGHAVLQGHLDFERGSAPDDAAQGGPRVFEGQVDMPGRRAGEVGNFAQNPYVPQDLV